MVRDYKRMRRQMITPAAKGKDPELVALLERKVAMTAELKDVRRGILAAKRSKARQLSPIDADALQGIRAALDAVEAHQEELRNTAAPVEDRAPAVTPASPGAVAAVRRRRRHSHVWVPPVA